jgi:hypothetical protein
MIESTKIKNLDKYKVLKFNAIKNYNKIYDGLNMCILE